MRFCLSLGIVLLVTACNSYDQYCTGNVAHTKHVIASVAAIVDCAMSADYSCSACP